MTEPHRQIDITCRRRIATRHRTKERYGTTCPAQAITSPLEGTIGGLCRHVDMNARPVRPAARPPSPANAVQAL